MSGLLTRHCQDNSRPSLTAQSHVAESLESFLKTIGVLKEGVAGRWGMGMGSGTLFWKGNTASLCGIFFAPCLGLLNSNPSVSACNPESGEGLAQKP